MYTYIELFSGPGGLATGFRRAGFVPVISIEASSTTVQTYSRNHDVQVIQLQDLVENEGHLENILNMVCEGVLIHGDIRHVSNSLLIEILNKKFFMDTVDMVVGCPPCESFSMAGKRLEEDDRNDLFKEVLRVAHYFDTKLVFFENVKGLLTKKRQGIPGGHFKHLTEFFEKKDIETGIRFKLTSKEKKDIILTASEYGVPQKRERLFLVAINEKYSNVEFKYPKKTHTLEGIGYVTVEEALYDLPKIHSGEGEEEIKIKYTYEKNNELTDKHKDYLRRVAGPNKTGVLTAHRASKHKDYMVVRFRNIKQGEGMKAACERLTISGQIDIVDEFFPRKLFAARGRRLIADMPSFTVTSHCFDEMLHPFHDRALTTREVARLQTFSDDYIFEGPYTVFHSSPIQDKYEQIGDAVPVILAEKLAMELINTLEKINEI
jgi:DNA (cytosine-5)-methyltransferase 1